MIDGFRLWGSTRCRQMGVPLLEGGNIKGGNDFDPQIALLSEGRALAVVVGDSHETPNQKGNIRGFPRLMQPSQAGILLARLPLPGAPPRRTRGGAP